jgi:hypothetical protein
LWLGATPEWERTAAELIAAEQRRREEDEAALALRKADKRRLAAEDAARRSEAGLVAARLRVETLEEVVDQLTADLDKAHDELSSVRAELADVRMERRHAADREAAALARLEAMTASPLDPLVTDAEPDSNPSATRRALAARVDDLQTELRAVSGQLADLAGRTAELGEPAADEPGGSDVAVVDSRTQPSRCADRARRPRRLAGGIGARSPEAALFLIQSGARVLVDGYNVAMLGWPTLSLELQRNALTDRLEDLAQRWQADLTVVFDGATVIGANAPGRRSVRVTYSPEGVSADDVIRTEVDRLPSHRAVVVVTNDNEIVGDVRSAGANVVPSEALLALL